MARYVLRVNGRDREIDAEPDDNLLSILRYDFGLTGSRFGCGEGQCGACTVLHVGDGDGDRRFAAYEPESVGAGCRAPARRECLPLRHLSTNREGGPTRRRTHADDQQHRSRAMSEEVDPCEIEPERYEWSECRRYLFELDRRDFMRLFGGGLLVVVAASDVLAQESGRRGGTESRRATPELAAWLHIDEDGRVTACTGKVEIGQNIRTSLSQVVADELRVPLSAVTLLMGDTDK